MPEREFTVTMRFTAQGLSVFDDAGNKITELERKVQQVGTSASTGFQQAQTAAEAFRANIGNVAERLTQMATGSNKAAQAVGQVTAQLGASSTELIAFAGGIAAVGVAYAVTTAATIRYGQELNSLSREIGVSATELSRYNLVAASAGLSLS